MPEQVVVIEDEVRDWVTDLELSSNEQKLITHPHFGQWNFHAQLLQEDPNRLQIGGLIPKIDGIAWRYILSPVHHHISSLKQLTLCNPAHPVSSSPKKIGCHCPDKHLYVNGHWRRGINLETMSEWRVNENLQNAKHMNPRPHWRTTSAPAETQAQISTKITWILVFLRGELLHMCGSFWL